MARILWRNGAEDGLIGQWRAEQEERRELEERLRDSQEANDRQAIARHHRGRRADQLSRSS